MQAWASAADMSRVSRVDAVYDYRGMLQQTTAYRSVNASGDGVLDGEQAVTRYVYDRSGRLISTVTPTGGATSYVYDGMGRVISVQNALGQTTLTQYDDVGNRMTLTQANGLRTVSVYDKAGQKISQYEQSPEGQNLGETRYVYDVLGRLRITTDPAGRQAFIVYDEAGRKTGDVDVNGILTEYQYNSQGRLWRTNTYSAKVDISNLVDAQGKPKIVQMGRLIPTGEKSSVWNFYDAAGRLAKTRDAANAVTEYRYDNLGRLVEEIGYAQRWTNSPVPWPERAQDLIVKASSADRHSYTFYTDDGKVRGTLDAEGLFTERVYDSAGREVQRITYGTRVENQGANPSFASAKPASSYQDIVEYKFYNGLGRLTGTLDGEGYLTEFVYDASGNLTTKVRYATSLTGANTGSTMPVKYSPDIAKMRPATSAQDQVWTYTYTRLDKVSSERNAEGALTLYVYDEMGRMTSMVRAAGTSTSRGVLSRYDLQGRLIGELSGEGAARIDGNQTQAQIDDIWRTYGTSYTYDAVGRRTSMVDGAGQRTLYYFDANGRVTHTINALGYVQENVYDNLGQLVETVRYGAPINTQGLNGGPVNDALKLALAAASNANVDIRATYTLSLIHI